MTKSSAPSTWGYLLNEARWGSHLAASPIHGERHWRAVAATGFALADLRPQINRRILLAFAMLHDCRRQDENWDPEHGARAADLAGRSKILRDLLEGPEIERLAQACLLHEKGRICPEDAVIGACWDADRYNLLRLMIEPRRDLLSSGLDDEEHWQVRQFSDEVWRAPPDWAVLVHQVEGAVLP